METVVKFIWGDSKITTDGDWNHEIKRHTGPWKKSFEQPRQHFKQKRHYFASKGPSSQSSAFSSSHVWMLKLDYEESRVPKNRCFWTVVLEKTLEYSLDFKEIQPVNPKGNQPWIPELEALMLKLKLQSLATWWEELTHWKRPWCWERLKLGEEGDNRGWDVWMASLTQKTLVWVSSRSWWWTWKPSMLQSVGSQESDTTERLNWTELNISMH